MKPDIIPIDNNNLELVGNLLFERSQTLKSYTEWKYQSDNDSRFKGVIAIADGNPVGCFGSIPKELKFSDGSGRKCGWFADWYVTPASRGLGIGELLLSALSDYERIMFGHPGPQAAQIICAKNKYKQIGFHSRRRLILRRWSYHWKRGVLYSTLKDKIYNKLLTFSNVNNPKQKARNEFESSRGYSNIESVSVNFVQSAYHENWTLNQPIAKPFKREIGEWNKGKNVIKYFDEQLENGERRRSLLFIDGENILDTDVWGSFIDDAKKEHQDYIEVFTTNRELDELFHTLGAWNIFEAPIIVRGFNSKLVNIELQPWDRENWSNLSHTVLRYSKKKWM
jgi:GNAT superfamily N-acetyltransferase